MEHRSGTARINAVILDYGEVLCHRPSKEEFDRLARKVGADADSFQSLWEKNRGAFDRGDMTAEAYWTALAEDAGGGIDAVQLNEVCKWDVEMWGNANVRMVAWLGQLRRGGIRTALLSNIHPAMISYLRENFDWLNLFDFKTFSAEVRLIKPDPGIYEHTLRGLGVTPGETLFVDDREINIRAARELGIRALQFRSIDRAASTGFGGDGVSYPAGCLGVTFENDTRLCHRHLRVRVPAPDVTSCGVSGIANRFRLGRGPDC